MGIGCAELGFVKPKFDWLKNSKPKLPIIPYHKLIFKLEFGLLSKA